MTTNRDGGPAFPMPAGPEPRVNTATHYNEGMTLRDWFAGQALMGIMARGVTPKVNGKEVSIEDAAYAMANNMIDRRQE